MPTRERPPSGAVRRVQIVIKPDLVSQSTLVEDVKEKNILTLHSTISTCNILKKYLLLPSRIGL